jgi:PAS domain S-box-containing protein
MDELSEKRKKMLKEIISELHAGIPPQEVKERFKRVLEGVSSEEIAKIEQELVREGMPREELQRLCDVHMAVFGEQLEKQELKVAPEHPLGILLEEHKILLQLLEKLTTTADIIGQACDMVYVGDDLTQMKKIVEELSDAEKHYVREENVLFPVLEKHGITEPPAIMWMEHDKIRECKKQIYGMVEKYEARDFQEFKKSLVDRARSLNSMLSSHIFKENTVLYPAALKVIPKDEWSGIRSEFDEIGYCCFTPKNLIGPAAAVSDGASGSLSGEGTLRFDTGSLSKEEVGAILDTIPVDISFVDGNDAVKYFNKAEKRIFVRTKAVIGRKVQMCHPQKSVHVVNKIVEAFKSGKKDAAEFWISMNDRMVHIRYFAVRDDHGKYLGTLEVTQDVTDIKKLEGQKRLLDWKA